MPEETLPQQPGPPETEKAVTPEVQAVAEVSPKEAAGEAAMGDVFLGSDGSDPREAGRIDNAEKAQDMANAGDEFRTRAAEMRDIQKDDHEKITEAERELRELHENTPSKLHPIGRRKHQQNFVDVRKEAIAEAEKHEDRKDARAMTEDEQERLGLERKLHTPEISAKAFDKRADELEEWAGILHDNPVRAVISEGLEIEVTPEVMVRFEDASRAADERLAELQESEWMKPYRDAELSEAVGVDSSMLEELLVDADETMLGDLESLLTQRNRADQELRTKIAQLREQVVIEPMMQENNKRKKALADIKAGAKQSEPEQSEDSQETTD